MSERWKPGFEEQYYFFDMFFEVCKMTNKDEDYNASHFAVGNCFKTKDEAEAATEKVKTLLLSLPDNSNNLVSNLPDKKQPKLTAEVFDRPDCPDWAKYAAVDADGSAFYYSEKPSFMGANDSGWRIACNMNSQAKLIPEIMEATDWQNSLIERPVKLPDWCKVGEWVYLSNEKYDKIESIDDFGINLTSGAFINKKYIHEEAVSARLWPYNAEEMKALVGKVFEDKGGNLYLAVSYIPRGRGLLIGGFYFNAEELLNANFTLDGKPCGKLEHLENGEWVE